MQYIAPIDINQPGAASEALDAVRQKIGTVPNIFTTLANAPAALNSYLAFSGALDTGHLDKKLREQIALAVAGVNECDYCASAHTFIAKSLGVESAEATRNLQATSADPKTAEILKFTADVVKNRALFDDNAAALDKLRHVGVTEAEIVEIIANIALNIFTNYFNHLAGTDIDFPAVDSKPGRAAA
ncbi:MAG: carboxymuconolactone decarboxylase family protein [Woeseiaceae bacterium]|nr:carboxymuconolactone decarboxylase family protein [Woeseiaceae bacterium]